MQAFLQSAFLQALSYSLIASIWQMALIWLVTVIFLKLFKFSSAQKFNLAFIAQVTGFGLFIYTSFHAYTTGAGKMITGTAQPGFIPAINTIIAGMMPYIALVYLCMLMFKLGRLIFIYNDTLELKRQDLYKISPDSRIFVQQMSELFSLHRKVKIYLSGKISCPLTTGFFKPVILIPFAAVNHLTTQQMEAVILHELAHIKRADYLLFILQSFIEKVFFFNIFSSMLGDIIERERENACDDWVLQFRYNSMHYAEALFKLGRLKTLPAFAMPFSGKKESLLMTRIKRLLHNPENTTHYSPRSVLLGLCSMLITAGLFISSPSGPVEQKAVAALNTTENSIEKDQNINTVAAVSAIPEASTTAIKQVKQENPKKGSLAPATTKQKIQESAEAAVNGNVQEQLKLKQDYLVNVRESLDSFRLAAPAYQQVVNANVVVTPEIMQKAMSYQNFKQIENMLAASGDSINITESEISKDSYRKMITIEATDKDGNKHIYNVIIELYQ